MLYVVSTPIGNLEDITYRAVRVLGEVDLIAAEDTRRTKILLDAYRISTPLTSYHSYNLARKTGELVRALVSGTKIAVVSDSGTPGISDPGSKLIQEAVKSGVRVVQVPGASALLAALVTSGLDTSSFIFEGFLSNKKLRRKNQLTKLLDEEKTVVLYESPHRIIAFLEDFSDMAPDRQVVVTRELTKTFEEVVRGTAKEVFSHLSVKSPKGEFVVIF